MNKRVKNGILFIGLSIMMVAGLSLLFAAITGKTDTTFGENYKRLFELCFMFFGAPCILGGALVMLTTKMKEDHCLGFGAALWYGASAIFVIFQDVLDLEGPDSSLFFLAFVLSSAICYIAWTIGFKTKE